MVVKAEKGVWLAHPFLMKKSFAADRLFGIMELLIGGCTPKCCLKKVKRVEVQVENLPPFVPLFPTKI